MPTVRYPLRPAALTTAWRGPTQPSAIAHQRRRRRERPGEPHCSAPMPAGNWPGYRQEGLAPGPDSRRRPSRYLRSHPRAPGLRWGWGMAWARTPGIPAAAAAAGPIRGPAACC